MAKATKRKSKPSQASDREQLLALLREKLTHRVFWQGIVHHNTGCNDERTWADRKWAFASGWELRGIEQEAEKYRQEARQHTAWADGRLRALNALLTDYGNCWGLLEKVAPQLLARLPHVDRDSIPTIDPTKYAQQMADVLGALLTDKKDVDAIDDESAYVSAVELWPERFSTYKKFTAWLGRHPEVANKSERQRLKIHAGQFITAWNAEVNRALDTDSTVVESVVAGIERRKADVDARKPARRVSGK